MAEPKTQKEEKTQPDAKFNQYLDDFRKSYNYVRDNYHAVWYDCWKVYSNKRVKIGYNSISDSFVPETRTIVESLVSNIAGGQPQFEYVPTTEEQNKDTKVLSELMNYYWDANHMGVKAQSWVRDSILYGTGVLHVTWDVEYNRPCIENVPLRDFFVDPTATSLETARFVGFRYLADKEALKSMKVIDPETGELVPKYTNLERIEAANNPGNNPDQMDKANKELLLGSQVGSNDENQVEVVLIYYVDGDEGRIVELANRATVIRDVATPYQQEEMTQEVEVLTPEGPQTVPKTIEPIKPFYPFAILRNTVDSSLFFGTGDVEVIMDRQETLNDVENLDMDNLHYINNVMWRIDPAYEDMASDIESTPGIVIPIPRFGLEPIQKPTITSDLDNKKQEIKDEMRRATAADEIIQGAQPTGSRTTATEIQAISTQANARFSTKVTNLESEGYAQLGSVLFKISQIFIDPETVVRIVGPEGVAFKDFDPFEFSGYYEPHVKLQSTIKRQEAERDMKDNQLYQLIIGNPVVNQQEAIRMISNKLGASDDEINRLLTLPPPPPMAAPAGAVPAEGAPGAVDAGAEEAAAIAAAREDFEVEQAIEAAREDFANEQ